jgi:hypothetical protein
VCGDAFFKGVICGGGETADDFALFVNEFAPGTQAACAATRAVVCILKAHLQSCLFAFNLKRLEGAYLRIGLEAG